jgi:NADPH2:quinone reductase
MLAAVCERLVGEAGVRVREHGRPDLPPAGVRVDVRAASVNYPDALMVRGLYQGNPEPPFIVGCDFAGVVTEVGADVRDFGVGDRVMGITQGAFATEAVARPNGGHVHRIPDETSFADGAALNMTYGTAYHGLFRRAALQSGESVLILGASGGCGSAAIQLAKAAGATVVALAGGDEKCAAARGLGADVVIDHQSVPSISRAVRDATDGRGVDVVFDPVGSEDGREQLRSLAWGGRFLVVGFASGHIPTVSVNQTILKNVSIVGYAWGPAAARDPAGNREDFEQIFAWYRQGLVTPLIGDRFALHDTADAIRAVHERRAIGKIVIEMPA